MSTLSNTAIPGQTARNNYATTFRLSFTARFTEAEIAGQSSFTITRKEWDNFVFTSGFAPKFETQPEAGDLEWPAYRNQMNHVRREMNKSSQKGVYGGEEFEVAIVNGQYTVRKINSMAKSSGGEKAMKMRTFLTNQFEDYSGMLDYWQLNSHKLEPEISAKVASHPILFNRLVSTIVSMIDGFKNDVSALDIQIKESVRHKQLLGPGSNENR